MASSFSLSLLRSFRRGESDDDDSDMTHHLPSSYLPSPPLSTPTVTKQLQFPQTRPRPSYLLPFPTRTSLPLNKLNFTSKLPPTPSSESLADPSSDQSSSPSSTTSPDFNQTILTHLKPPGPLVSSSSSFSPFFPPTAHRAQEIPRARNISFSATPLGSLNASPRHRPYSISSTRRRVPSTSIYSHPSFDLLPPLTDLSNSTPAARSRRRAEKKPLPLVQPDEDDVPTDDEADEDAVEHLLLSQEQLAVSPLRIQAFSLPFPDRTPRGILKKWHHPILKVTNALEGCKRNGGRRKHTLSFCDAEGVKNAPPPPPKDARNCVTAVAVQELAESGGKSDSAGGSGEETGGKEGGRKTRGDATRSGAAGKVGGGNASDHRDDERRAGGLPACVPKFVDLRDDDPIHLRTPLITLRASLRNLRRRTANDDQGSPGLATRSTTSTRRASHLHASMRRSPTGPPSRPNFDDFEDVVDDDPANATDAPTTLHEVDTAYIALVRALIRLPTTLVDEAATLQPLREFRVSLLRCLERDLSNILSFPSATRPSSMSRDLAILHGAASSSGSSSSSPAREDGTSRARTGLSDAEMRRQKDEVGAAQAAIKCAAALVQLHRFSSIFSPQELSTLLSIILRIPGSPGLSSSVHKDIYPFISWFLHMQRLSLSLLDPHLPRILSVIRTTLTNPDKPRHNLVEGISAIGRFLLTHPEATLMQSDKWLWIVVEGLWEVPRKGMAVRIRAGATLGAVVRALVTKWDSKAEEEQAEEEKEKRDALAIDISNTFNALLKRATHDPDYPTCLQQLFNQLANALRTDEAPWAVNIIALIPALLKHNFRRLETAGVRPWVSLVSQVRSHSSLHLRALGNLLWNHLIFAFLNTSHTNPLTAGTLSWSFGEGRLSVLTGVFQTQRSVWSEYDRVSQVQREKATVLAQVLAGAVYGLSVLNRDLPPFLVVDSEAPATVDPQLEQYDILWARLVMGGWIKDVQRRTNVVEVVEGEGRRKFTGDDVLAAILSRYEETAIIGWSILAAIVKPPSEATQSAGLEALINPVFLDGSVAKTKVPTAQALLIARALAKAPQPVAIPGWSTRWTVANAEKVLEMVDKCLGGERRADLSELCVAPFWRNFMLAFAAEPENPALEPGVLAILEWLIRLPTLAFFGAASASPLARLLITTTFDVLGDHLLRLPLDAEGAHPFLRLATAFFTTSTMAAQEATRFEPLATKMLQSALALSEKPLPLLASATSSFAIRLLDQPPSDLLPLLVSQWTNALANPDVQLVVAELESLVKLLRSYQRDPTAGEAWQELAKSALVAVFDRSDSSAAMSGSFVELLGRVELCGDHHLEHLLLSVSAEQPASTQGVISNLASNALCSLAKDISRNGDLVANMLEIAPDRFLIPLYKAVLLTLKSVVTPTSRELEAAIPLLAPCLTRALDHVDLCGDAVLVFHEFWIATFANVALEFDLPDDFADLLGIIRSATLEGRLANVGETQCEPQASTLPPPGQRSPATRPDDSATSLSSCEVVEQSGREYEADVSMALDSTRTSIPASYRVPISSSLRVPDPSVDVNPSPVEEELATPQIDETPPDEQVKASLPSQQRRTSAKRSRSPSPSQQPPKSTELIACSSSIIIDGSDDEDSVVAPARGGRPQARSSSTDTGSQGSSKNKSKRAKSAAVVPPTASTSKAARGEKRKVKSGPSFEVEVEVKRRPKGDTTSSHKRVSPAEPVAGPSSKRRRTLKGSIDVDSNDNSHVATPSPVEEQADVFRRLLTRSPDGAAEEVERLGSPLLRRLKMLGERATAQFLKRGTNRGGHPKGAPYTPPPSPPPPPPLRLVVHLLLLLAKLADYSANDEDGEVDFSDFLEDGLFSDFQPLHDVDGKSRDPAGQFFQRADDKGPLAVTSASHHTTPSSAYSPAISSPFPVDSSHTSASTSPQFVSFVRANSLGSAMNVGNALGKGDGLDQPVPYNWLTGSQGFTVDGGGGGDGTGSNVSGSYPLSISPAYAPPNSFFPTLSSSYPVQLPQEWLPAPSFANSYSGSPSFLQSYPAYPSSLSQTSSVPASPFHHPAMFSPPGQLEQSLLTLHMSLEAQAQARYTAASMSLPSSPAPSPAPVPVRGKAERKSSTGKVWGVARANGAGGPPASRTSQLRGETQLLPGPPPPHYLHSNSGSPTTSAPGSPSTSSYPSAHLPPSYQRPLPLLPRRTTGSSISIVTPSPYVSHPSSPYTSAQPSRTPSIACPTPPLVPSRPPSPRISAVDYDFSSLERELDTFASNGGFASAAAAAMASVGPGRNEQHKGLGAYGVGGYGSLGGMGFNEDGSPKVLADVLAENAFPARSPGSSGASRVNSPAAEVPPYGEVQVRSGSGSGGSTRPSPSGESPSGSTGKDDETGETLSKKDPIAAQVWRMFNKAKQTLPNGARMENLTWRLMSMTLKKRREETAAAEAEAMKVAMASREADAAAAAVGEELEGIEELGRLRGRTTKGKGKGREGEREVGFEGEDGGRGRRGRSSTSKSASASPEAFGVEEDAMDWRAKSVSRSRSRAPGDMSMDWRAQSRSRSRAPDFRVRPPSLSRPEASSATAQVSRFHGDTGGAVASPTEDHSLQSLASSLGLLSPNAVGGAAGFDGSTLDHSTASSSTFAFPPDAQSPQDPTTNPNLAEIENTLNQLITLQSLSASVPHPVPPWPINTSSTLSPSTDSLAHSPRPALAFASPSYAASPYADAVALHNLEQASVGSPHTDYGFLQKLSMGSYDRGVSSPGALQQLLAHPSSVSSSLSRQVSTSPYINAANLAQATRPFSFAPSSASGLSLARPSQVLPETSHALSPGQSHPPTPTHAYPSSAPVHQGFINPPTSYFVAPTQPNPLLFDYFDSHGSSSGYTSPYLTTGSLLEHNPTMHVNPSQLLNNLHTLPTYESDASSWGASPRSGNDSSKNGTPSPPGIKGNQLSAKLESLKTSLGGGARSTSYSNLAAAGNGTKSKPTSAPASRVHSRSNTLGMTSATPVYEKPLAAKPDTNPNPKAGDESVTTCLNCSTTNTPLWRRDTDGRPLCNACGLFRNLHGIDRPATLNTGVIKKRNRARGPKDQVPKKAGSSGRAAARRNSSGASPPATTGRATARAGAGPYPPASVRAQQ